MPAGVGDAQTKRGVEPAGWVVILIVSAVWGWWAIKEGAYFGAVLYPGTFVLACAVAHLALGAPARPRLLESPAIAIPLASLVGLAGWYALSAFWSPAPDIAVTDALRVLAYGLACGIGLWLVTLLGSRPELALVPVAAAGAVAGSVTVGAFLIGDNPGTYLYNDGTLTFPLGYRNANAAFFLIALWPALGLASDRAFDWRLRGVAAATATLCIALAIMCQSRGSMAATPLALVAFLALSPHRARALVWLLIALLPALAIIPATVDVYATGDDDMVGDALDELRNAGRVLLAAGAITAIAGIAWARAESRVMSAASRAIFSWNKLVAIAGVVLALGGAVAFVAKVGDPVDWVDERFDELGAGNPARGDRATRFGFDAGSHRTDLWSVALDRGSAEPVLGDGGGAFQYEYARERDVPTQYARDAHSVALEVFSELGYPGLILLLVVVGGLVLAALRAMRTAAAARALSAAALAAAAYWLVHTSVDWFWSYPAVSAPVLFLLGAAGGALVRETYPVTRRARIGLIAGAALIALVVVPPYLSERYVNTAYREWRSDIDRAYRDLDRAETFNPLSDQPMLAEGGIAREAGDRDRAIDAFRRAVEKRPEEYAGHYFLVLLYRNSDPDLARAELHKVRELDPLNPDLEQLESSISGTREPAPAP